MTWGLVAVATATVVGGAMASDAQSNAADQAASAQTASAQAGIDEQRRQFDAIQKLLAPYANAGTGALTGQQNLLGLNGANAQQAAITALQNSPQFQSQLKLGENSILANASATGGLRGGNTQAALAQFSPQLLAQTINDQYSKLGGITTLGQNSAAMTGNAGMQTGNNVANLLQQQGAAQAGSYLAQGRANAGLWNSIGGAVGAFGGLGGFGKLGGAASNSGGLMSDLTDLGVF